jgi:hypothetical protein
MLSAKRAGYAPFRYCHVPRASPIGPPLPPLPNTMMGQPRRTATLIIKRPGLVGRGWSEQGSHVRADPFLGD